MGKHEKEAQFQGRLLTSNIQTNVHDSSCKININLFQIFGYKLYTFRRFRAIVSQLKISLF